jgi:hypothetical protein
MLNLLRNVVQYHWEVENGDVELNVGHTGAACTAGTSGRVKVKGKKKR